MKIFLCLPNTVVIPYQTTSDVKCN